MAATTLTRDAVKQSADAQGMSMELAQYMARVVNTPLSRADIKAVHRLMLDNFIASLRGERQP